MSQKSVRSFNLPSKGLLYDGQIPDGLVKCYLWDTDVEEIFSAGYGSSSQLITEVLNRCLFELPFPSTELLVGDRYYAFMRLRSESYGGSYTFPFKCGSCSFKFKKTVELMEDLETIQLPDGSKEPFDVELPDIGAIVQFRLLRGSDEEDIDNYLERFYQKKADASAKFKSKSTNKKKQNPIYKYRIAKQIVGVGGEVYDFDQALELVKEMSGMDSMLLKRAINDVEPRLDINISIECPRCDYDNETVLPFTRDLISPQ